MLTAEFHLKSPDETIQTAILLFEPINYALDFPESIGVYELFILGVLAIMEHCAVQLLQTFGMLLQSGIVCVSAVQTFTYIVNSLRG